CRTCCNLHARGIRFAKIHSTASHFGHCENLSALMHIRSRPIEIFSAKALAFYRDALEILEEARLPFLVGGASAFAKYTGIVRCTKHLDLFVQRENAGRALAALAAAGYRTELSFSHWLGKAFHGEDVVDIIFNSGNALCVVDAAWFDHAVESEVVGKKVR